MNTLQVCWILTFCAFQNAVGIPNLAGLLRRLQGGGGGMFGGDMGGGGNSGPCPYKPHINKYQFTQMDNQRLVVKDCAPGTMYDASACTCVMASGGPGASSGLGGIDAGLGSNLLNFGSLGGAGSEAGSLASLLSSLQLGGPHPPPVPTPVKPRSRARTNHMDIFRSLMNNNAKATNKLSPAPAPPSKPKRRLPGGLSIHMLKQIQLGRKKPKPTPSSSSAIYKLLQNSKASPKPKPTRWSRPKPKPTRWSPPKPKPTRWSPPKPTGSTPKVSNPIAALLAKLGGGSSRSKATRPTKDPLAALLASLDRRSPSSAAAPFRSSGGARRRGGGGGSGGRGLAGLLGGLGGGRGGGGMGDIMGLFGGSGRSGGGGGGGGGRGLDLMSMGGNMRAAALLGETPGIGLARNMDLSDYLNMQGALGVGGGLSGLRNVNAFKLHQMDRADILDVGDLTPHGLVAAGHYTAG